MESYGAAPAGVKGGCLVFFCQSFGRNSAVTAALEEPSTGGPPADPAAIAELRDRRVRDTVAYCAGRSRFYRDRLREAGAEPGDIAGVADLERLPILLDKEAERELQERSRAEEGHPFGEHLCAPLEDVVAVASTSGTTGAPTFYAFTAADAATTDELWSRALRLIGVRPGDTVLHGFGLSMFLAGYPVARAVERMGARIVPIGAEAGSERLLRMADLVRPRVLLCTPSLRHLPGRAGPRGARPAGVASSASRSSAAPASPAPACPRCAPTSRGRSAPACTTCSAAPTA